MTLGDFATTRVDRTFRLAYLLRNTITNLTTEDEQVDCFRNVAAHRIAGLSLRERWNDWHRTPFTSESRNHISVWEKTP